MIFQPELADAVMAGRKTVTRRLVSSNPRSPWAAPPGGPKAGKDAAVQIGRGKGALGRVRVVRASVEPLGRLTDAEARAEGFTSRAAFETAWLALHGCYNATALVWRVEFERMDT